jgi:hypothetical protein
VSLAEVIVVLAVLGIAAAAVGRIAVGQGEHYRDFAASTQTRSGLREGAAVLAAELRGVAPVAGDLYPGEMRDASIAFRSTTGTFELCEPAPAGASTIDVIDLNAETDSTAPRGAGDSGPAPGDSLWLYDSGAETGGADDRWRPNLVVAIAALRRACTGGASAELRDADRLSLSHPVAGTTEPHAPTRLFRRVRYALYQSSDGLWYLGFSDCRPVVRTPPCATLQPVSGPYEPYAAPGARARSGLTLSYFDRNGLVTADPVAVARLAMTFRGRANAAGRLAWDAAESRVITLRNAER